MFRFYDPHPGGVMGCTKALPSDIKMVIDEIINDQPMTLARAKLKIMAVAEGKVESHWLDNDLRRGMLLLKQKDGKDQHSWRLLSYEDEEVAEECKNSN